MSRISQATLDYQSSVASLMSPPRMYQEAWNQLKRSENRLLRIAAHPRLHHRIFIAICKEKNMDVIYKLLLSESGTFAKLIRETRGGELRITLVTTTPLSWIGLDDI